MSELQIPADFRDVRPLSHGSEQGVSRRDLCSSVKSVDVFLRNLRNLWFFLAKAESLRPRITRSVTDVHGFLGRQGRQDDAKTAKK